MFCMSMNKVSMEQPNKTKLVKTNCSKRRKQSKENSINENSHFCANDIMGLCWVLSDDFTYIGTQNESSVGIC